MTEETKPKCDVDPVCGIDLTAEHGKFAYDFEERTYYFCSEACRDQFAAEPEKYVKEEKS
ncbi:MAG: YHS domain-containing protein [Desulfobacteraceae bacterium]